MHVPTLTTAPATFYPVFGGQRRILPAAVPDRFTPQFGTQISYITPREGQAQLQHYTYMFREPGTLGALAPYLRRAFPKGVPIEIYAGSDGSDALSMGIMLLGMLGEEGAKRYPIITSDLVPENMDRSRQGIVGASGKRPTAEAAQQWLRKQWTVTQFMSKDAITGKVADYIDPDPLPEESHEDLLFKNGAANPLCPNGVWSDMAEREFLFRLQPDVKRVLDQTVRFCDEPVDIVEALSHKAQGWRERRKPRMIMFRNAAYLLSQDDRRQLIDHLKHNVPKGSLLVLGSSDYVEENYIRTWNYRGSDFLKALQRAGWYPLQSVRRAWIKLN